MGKCPECGCGLDISARSLEAGDIVRCPQCASNLEVMDTSEPKFELIEDDELDDDDEIFGEIHETNGFYKNHPDEV